MHPASQRLIATAGRQGGCFTRRQALEAGYSPSQVHNRLKAGRWIPLSRGVYRAVESAPHRNQRLHACLAAVGPESFLSHATAASEYGFCNRPTQMWCSVPLGAHVPRLPGVVVIRTRHPEYVVRNGMRVATPARALVDLGMTARPSVIAASLATAVQAGAVSLEQVCTVAHQLSGRPGTAELAHVLATFDPAFESILGEEFVRLLREEGLPVVAGLRIATGPDAHRLGDACCEDVRVDFEADGFAFHALPHQVQRDKIRDRELASVDWLVSRFTTTDIRDDPQRTKRDARAVYEARRQRLRRAA